MKIKFESNQQYQIDAVNSIVNIFDGQPLDKGDFVITETQGFFGSTEQTELGIIRKKYGVK